MDARICLLCCCLIGSFYTVTSGDPLPLWYKINLRAKSNIIKHKSPDYNNDGYVDDGEAEDYLEIHGEDLDDFLSSADEDSNSAVDVDEFHFALLFLTGKIYYCDEGKKACMEKQKASNKAKSEL
ncbi:hypothetical protein SNE40_019500 [Patella caerulea]|uniref:EF-hand domain-containing protein n=1 Tax=Patella caerulea TaxID=87958 RepID=A0AAN8J7A9_PATCE